MAAAGVVNAASFAGGLTPGSLTTIFAAGVLDAPGAVIAGQVPLPLALGGVSITVAGVAAPIASVSNVDGQEQVNFQAPWEAAGRAAADIVVTRDGQSSAPASVPVNQVQPGVYGVVVHAADYSLVTAAHPLAPGEYAFVYASGLGAVSNPPAGAGGPLAPLAATIADVRVSLGGVPCDVQFAGLWRQAWWASTR